MNSLLTAIGTLALCICLNSCLQMPTKIYRKEATPDKAGADSVPAKSTAHNAAQL